MSAAQPIFHGLGPSCRDRASGVWRHLGKGLKVSAGSVRKDFSYQTEGLNNI